MIRTQEDADAVMRILKPVVMSAETARTKARSKNEDDFNHAYNSIMQTIGTTIEAMCENGDFTFKKDFQSVFDANSTLRGKVMSKVLADLEDLGYDATMELGDGGMNHGRYCNITIDWG